MNKLFCDVLIFGAGIIGSTLALRLAQSNIKVIIVDHKCSKKKLINKIPDIKVLAINYASTKFLQKIDIWKNINSKFYTTYSQLETWEYSQFRVSFHSMSLNLAYMGFIIETNRLQLELWNSFKNTSLISFYCPVSLISMKYDGFFWNCFFDKNITVISRLIIGADGANSQIRKMLGMQTISLQYNQFCMLFTIKMKKLNNKKIVWQMFTPYGPIAFLPLYDSWGTLMWYNTPNYVRRLQNLSLFDLEKKICKKFYNQLGKIKLYNSKIIPLIRQDSSKYIDTNSVLIGDAAHVIHPLAGQGINLGFRDVEILSNLLINSYILDKNWNISKILDSYQERRKKDIFLMKTGIDCLYLMFHNNFFPIKIIRNSIFTIVENSKTLKKNILKYAMGLYFKNI